MDTVADLIRSLQQMPQDAKPVLGADHNGIAEVYSVQTDKALKGDADFEPINQSDIDAGEYGENPEIVTYVYIWS